MINKKGYYYSQHYNPSFWNKSQIHKELVPMPIVTGVSMQKPNNQ